jgi:hypothetical protein
MATIVSVVPSKYLWTLKNELHEEFWKAQIWTYWGTKIQKLQAPCHIISHSTKPWGGVDHKAETVLAEIVGWLNRPDQDWKKQ